MTNEMSQVRFTVDEVVKRLGITPRTLRYYEEMGLISPPPRSAGGHRLYDDQVVQQITHILRIRDNLGASLDEIGRIVSMENSLERLWESYRLDPPDDEKRRILSEGIQLLQDLMVATERKIERLQSMRDAFQERLTRAQRVNADLESTEASQKED